MNTDMNVWSLISEATLVVQLVMALLLIASIASWVIIFAKRTALARFEKRSREFEERFWSGADAGELYERISNERNAAEGQERLFEAGFREFQRLREDSGTSPDTLAAGARRAMRVARTREIDRLIQAIMDGVPGAQVKDKIAAAEARKAELETLLSEAKEEPVRLHPNMGAHYRDQVAGLCEALGDEDRRAEATTIIRSLVDRIVLRPAAEDGEETLAIDLEGHLAGILTLASNAKRSLSTSDPLVREITLVAGAGFEPATFRL